ncbi:cysteine synthase family protein [Caproiciproducens sp. NJN-50]|uniref:PLP-dependent cysteine synthase family protein n=1 Tax=Acutalibacteraceae TaxID=3082771 RepID=UPI000FFE0AC4|nr:MULTISPECIES: cysteine synthase family protein [Acutalibacteraceae]QAT50420.1 cysteine synthase family protein [Caproiciproducens sp. NJN-50]
MTYYNDVREMIGHTPLLKLNHMDFRGGVNVFAKLELFNPGGSVKDRMGSALVSDAEERGLLKPGYTILEATAGNAGIGIALAALGRGYRVIFAVPEKFSEEKQTIMKAYGAEIVHTPLEKGMQGAIEKVEELKKRIEHPVTLSQFENPANPLAHYRTTGPEIWKDLDGKVDILVAGAGSGGTLSGAAKYLKEQNAAVKVVMADPVGSTMGGGEPGCYAIEGIGNTFMPGTMDMSLVDQVYKVGDEEAFKELRLLAGREGILAGTSSGAALSAARKAALKAPEGSDLVAILPDRGDRYFSKHIYG